jgi:hypothetical protein
MLESQPRMTLKAFVEENHRLISVLGVFAALDLFALQLKLGPWQGIMLGGLFTCTMLLWVELQAQFPKEMVGRLSYFEWGFQAAMLMVVLLWILVMEKAYGIVVLQLPVFFGLLVGSGWVLRRTGLQRRFESSRLGRKRGAQLAAGLVLALLCGVVAGRFSRWANPSVHKALEEARSDIGVLRSDSTVVGAR